MPWRAVPFAAILLATACGQNATAPAPALPSPAPSAPTTTPAQPEPPEIPIVQLSHVGRDFVEWEWDPVEGATRYVVDVAEGRTLDNRRQDTTEDSRYRMVGLEPDQLVVIWVRAIRETAGGTAASDWSHRVWGVTSNPASETEPRACTDEKARAEARLARARPDWTFITEWDGTPFRVDVMDTFPDHVPRADVIQHLLDAVALADEKIEQQIGYRIIERGELLPVPEGIEPGWNEDLRAFRINCPLPRERGQILGLYMDLEPGWGAQAHSRCGAFSYFRSSRLNGGTTIHEIWHLFGFEHDFETDLLESGVGVAMSKALTSGGVLTYADIDALRCIFPE